MVELRDGSRALVRPIEPGDRWRLEAGLRDLSPRSRYLRFHTAVDHLTDAQLRYLTEVDQDRHVALVALDADDLDAAGMGVARFVRLPEEPHVADAAITVVDRYQGRGLGTILLELLAREAVGRGVTVLRNYVLASNEAMLAIFDELGAHRSYDGAGVYVVDVTLPSDPDKLPHTAAARLLRAAARHEVPPIIPILPSPEDRQAPGRDAPP